MNIINKYGYKGWYKIRKYGFQNYAELTMLRYKKIIGPKMHSRDLLRQKNEAVIATSILNKFTTLGVLIQLCHANFSTREKSYFLLIFNPNLSGNIMSSCDIVKA